MVRMYEATNIQEMTFAKKNLVRNFHNIFSLEKRNFYDGIKYIFFGQNTST